MSGIDNAQKAMGWQSGNQRDRCGNCDHARDEFPVSRFNSLPTLRCDKGGFYTRVNAVCQQHVRATNT